MLEYYLGIMIDQGGNFFSFGKWIPSILPDSPETCFHANAFLSQAISSKWLLYHDFNINQNAFKNVDNFDFYSYCEEWSKTLKMAIFINGSDAECKVLSAFVPQITHTSMEQRSTILNLKKDILRYSNYLSFLVYEGVIARESNLHDYYNSLEKSRTRYI